MLAGGSPRPLGGAKSRALLGLLLLRRGATLPRETLVDDLWGESPPKAVGSELRVYIAKLRKVLPPDALVTRDAGYALLIGPEYVDADHFQQLLRHGSAVLAGGDAETAADVLAESLALWRGPVLAELADAPWAQGEARRLDELRLTALEGTNRG